MRVVVCVLAVSLACGKAADEKPGEPSPAVKAPAPAPAESAPAEPAQPAKPKHEDRDEPAEAPAALTLEVKVDGTTTTWQRDVFDKVPKMPGRNRGGESRDVWSVRALAEQVIGPGARVVSVTGDGTTQPITAEQWADPAHTPILHTTRRGTFKFRWALQNGEWQGDAVRDVTGLEIVR